VPSSIGSCSALGSGPPSGPLRLGQPEAHVHLAIHRGGGGQGLLRLCLVASPAVELAETEVAVGDERAHVELGRPRQRLLVGGFGFRHGGWACLRGNLTEKPPRPRLGPPLELGARLLKACLAVLRRPLHVSGGEIRLTEPALNDRDGEDLTPLLDQTPGVFQLRNSLSRTLTVRAEPARTPERAIAQDAVGPQGVGVLTPCLDYPPGA